MADDNALTSAFGLDPGASDAMPGMAANAAADPMDQLGQVFDMHSKILDNHAKEIQNQGQQVQNQSVWQRLKSRDTLANALSTFIFSLGQGMQASAQYPGARGGAAGMGAALQGPQQLQMLQQQRQAQMMQMQNERIKAQADALNADTNAKYKDLVDKENQMTTVTNPFTNEQIQIPARKQGDYFVSAAKVATAKQQEADKRKYQQLQMGYRLQDPSKPEDPDTNPYVRMADDDPLLPLAEIQKRKLMQAQTDALNTKIGGLPQSTSDTINRINAIFGDDKAMAPLKQRYIGLAQATPFSPQAHEGIVKNAETLANQVSGAQAEQPGKIQQAVQTALATTAAMQGNDPRLQGVPPKDYDTVRTQVMKIEQDYNKAQEAQDNVQAVLADAKKGNKVAYSYIPAEGAIYMQTSQGIKRMNMAEAELFGGGGSALDRIRAFVGKQATGQSIPPNILKDMETLTGSIGQNAGKQYQRNLQSVDKVYGSHYSGDQSTPRQAMGGLRIGQIVNGRTYLGGAPNDRNSWR